VSSLSSFLTLSWFEEVLDFIESVSEEFWALPSEDVDELT